MKNKRAKQMMLDCGNDELLEILITKKLNSAVESLIRKHKNAPTMDIMIASSRVLDEFSSYFVDSESDK